MKINVEGLFTATKLSVDELKFRDKNFFSISPEKTLLELLKKAPEVIDSVNAIILGLARDQVLSNQPNLEDQKTQLRNFILELFYNQNSTNLENHHRVTLFHTLFQLMTTNFDIIVAHKKKPKNKIPEIFLYPDMESVSVLPRKNPVQINNQVPDASNVDNDRFTAVGD